MCTRLTQSGVYKAHTFRVRHQEFILSLIISSIRKMLRRTQRIVSFWPIFNVYLCKYSYILGYRMFSFFKAIVILFRHVYVRLMIQVIVPVITIMFYINLMFYN